MSEEIKISAEDIKRTKQDRSDAFRRALRV
jgi:hypothetical protein